MQDGLLVFDLKPGALPSWGRIPDEVWHILLHSLPQLGVDGFGFADVTSVQQLRTFCCFADQVPHLLGVGTYTPYHGIRGEQKQIAVWELDHTSIHSLSEVPVDVWSSGNPGYSSDELVFFRRCEERVLVVPYESLIFFRNLENDEINILCSLDDRIRNGLYNASATSLLAG